jgi:23S rRNA (adenine2030-N6)-methyltransferase
MNYRHAFHAGNHADILKHAALLLVLAHLKRKETPFAVLDTHAGRGAYDLTDAAAQRSPEWRGGINRLWNWADAPAALTPLLDAVRRFNPDGALKIYPGSPSLIAEALRPQDRLAACELQSDEAAALERRFRARRNVQIHERDGWEALMALLPFPERRGVVLIDPPYEAPDELNRASRALRDALGKFGRGIFLWWRPLKQSGALDGADAEALAYSRADALRVDLDVAEPAPTGPLTASSLLIVNPTHLLGETLAQAAAPLSAELASGPGARMDVRALPADKRR